MSTLIVIVTYLLTYLFSYPSADGGVLFLVVCICNDACLFVCNFGCVRRKLTSLIAPDKQVGGRGQPRSQVVVRNKRAKRLTPTRE